MSKIYQTEKIIKRYSGNPILSPKDIPYESSLVFNAGVTKFNGKYVMVLRNDYGVTEESFKNGSDFKVRMGFATSKDGINWDIDPDKNFLTWMLSDEITHIYDPRLTVIEGRCYMCFATNTRHGLRAGIAVTDDFDKFELLSMTIPDNRNMVLFPEKINGNFVRLERPFPVYSRDGKDRFDIWISDSADCRYWGDFDLLLAVEDVPFANNKIGPGAPPVKTSKGWLTLFHSVDFDETQGKNGWEDKWQKRYMVGVMLLDLKDPRKIIGISKEPLIVPETTYEMEGYRGRVIFPGGMILEDSGEVKIYYGAADTVECLATTHVDSLLKLCGV
jgi:beta-1,4-mannooligosaccharide/beta-1,4-mannosyl-N-acetylglucosamine phosphorylase